MTDAASHCCRSQGVQGPAGDPGPAGVKVTSALRDHNLTLTLRTDLFFLSIFFTFSQGDVGLPGPPGAPGTLRTQVRTNTPSPNFFVSGDRRRDGTGP